MSRPSNKEIEQYYFDSFKRHYPLPLGQIEHTDKPDVMIHGQIVYGIEITNLYLTDGEKYKDGSSEQAQRSIRDDVLKKAQDQHFANGGQKIVLIVSFDPLHPIINKKRAKILATALAEVAKIVEALPIGKVDIKHFNHINEVCFIYHNAIGANYEKWLVQQIYTGSKLSIQRLKEAVAIKTKALEKYKPCDVYWLLLIVDFMDRAQDQEIDWPESEAALVSPFEKIIIYKPQFAKWTEVPCFCVV